MVGAVAMEDGHGPAWRGGRALARFRDRRNRFFQALCEAALWNTPIRRTSPMIWPYKAMPVGATRPN